MATLMDEENINSITNDNTMNNTGSNSNDDTEKQSEPQTSKNEKRYFDLLPDETKEDHTSFLALNEALENSRIHNIAITGSYGAGKSSLLKSYIKSQHLENKCIEISLASFACKKSENQWDEFINNEKEELVYNDETCDEEKSEIKISDIETSILQQIVYKKSADKLPNSKFSRIKHIPDASLKNWANLLIWYITSIVVFAKFENIISYIFPMVDFINKPGLIVSCGLKCASLIPIVIYSIKLFKKLFFQFRKISNIKINIKSAAEIELNSEFHNSVLNRRLDEILYFFECCPQYEIVIFEDLDRFENPEIYTRLRELNLLLNGYEKLINDERKRICFIYALRDNVFEGTERVKFFDFIIPVIPVINSSNSANFLIKFKEKHAGSGYFNGIEDEYLKDICRFIEDMRLLKNIINEYIFYVDKIHGQKNINLFSLIVYKNLFPNDFSKLQYGEGKLAGFIKSKEKIFNEICNESENEILDLKQKISDIQKEQFDNVKDLRRLYLLAYFSTVNSTNINITSIVNDYLKNEKFQEIQNNKTISYSQNGYLVRPYSIDLVKLQEKLGQTKSYQEREDDILSKKDIAKLTNKINEIKKSIIQIKTSSFSDLANKYPEIVQNYISFGEYKYLISYFISNGYIDEDYLEYISLFYEGVLTKEDNNFISSVRVNNPLPYDYKLSNIKNIIEAIHPYEWAKSKSLLNNDLISYLVINNDLYKTQLNGVLQVIANESELTFLKNQISGRYENFIKNIFSEISGLWGKMESTYDETELLDFAPIILFGLDKSEVDDDFVNFINYHSSIVNRFDYLNTNEIISKLSDMEVSFQDLSDIDDVNIMLELVNKKRFVINFKNLQIICQILDKRTGVSTITNCLSIIFESGSPILVQFIKEYIVQVLNILLENLESLEELLDPILFICNNQTIKDELKNSFLLKNKTVISDISQIENQDLWNVLLINKTIYPNWENVFLIFSNLQNQLTVDFINYLNDKNIAKKLSEQKIDAIIDLDKYEVSNFFKQVSQKTSITFETLKLLVPLSKLKFGNYDYDSLGKDKVKFLVETNSIMYSKDELDKIRNFDSSLLSTYINFNLDEYLADTESYSFADIEKFILDINIANKKKEVLFEKTRVIIFENSEKFTNDFVSAVYNLKLDLSNDEISKILENQQINYENKVKTFIGPFPIGNSPLNHEFILKSLCLIDECLSDLKNKSYILIPDTDINNELFNYLNLQGLFSSKKEKDGHIKMNIAKSFFKDGQ